ncbi:hypothetical protein CN645_33605 [Burkholderia sp. IDO3]|nr:hypothetical protein DCN14_31525 [Burkholderia sp. IDO3]PCD57518.1 hypothetical protein CN645_33605 [Burkholderia sp. IDO3]
MKFRRRAFVGAGGIDAASLGFGRQTKHPARRQAPLPAVQHCGDWLARASASRHRPFIVRPAACRGRRASGLSPLVQARCAS